MQGDDVCKGVNPARCEARDIASSDWNAEPIPAFGDERDDEQCARRGAFQQHRWCDDESDAGLMVLHRGCESLGVFEREPWVHDALGGEDHAQHEPAEGEVRDMKRQDEGPK